jgi:hypothetical protein
MAGQTPYFGLAFFDFKDRLDLPINVRKEIERFLMIDKQLYGLYTIFGNGVIRGWEVTEPVRDSQQQSIQVSVAPGIGIIDLIATETTFPILVRNLPPNDTLDIYAVVTGGTINSRDVEFIWSRVSPGSGSVRLARVVTGSNDIVSIDDSYRDEIGFIEIIEEEIAKHKHRGSPTKIDLQSETRNQLPGARMEDFDAEKIISGRFDTERIPKLDHNDLDNNGLLTHAALDSFVRTITSGNRELLGEVGSVNLMKLMLAWKYAHSSLDEGFINAVTVVPGITSNTLIDFDASSAYISLASQCISGKPTSIGQVHSVIWETTSAFLSAYDKNLVTIAANQVILTRGGASSRFIENFEQVPQSGVNIPGFSTQTQVIADNLTVTSEGADSLRTEGFYSGKFNTDRDFRAMYTKAISNNRDWSLYDEIIIDVKSLAVTHGAVYMYFVNGTGETATQSQTYLLLGPDEITVNSDPEVNGFERRSFSISEENRNEVSELVIYTDDIKTKHVFYVDNIFLRNQSLYPPEGFIRFRYSSGVSVTFNSISYESTIPEGCELRVRIRTANSTSLLNRAVFTAPLQSGDVFALDGTDAEIDIMFFSNTTRTATPILEYLELQLIVDSEEIGFTIDEADEWDRGTYVNAERGLDDIRNIAKVTIASPVPVGNIYFSFRNGVNEIDPSLNAVYGFQGSGFFLSPKQASTYAQTQGQRGFKFPFSVYRLPTKNFLVADLDNDRVLEVDPDGNFVRGVGSHNISDSKFFYPLVACYNSRTGLLTTCFSQEVDGVDLDKTKVVLWIGGSPIALGANDVIQESAKTKRIIEIYLSPDKQAQLFNSVSAITVEYRSGSFPKAFEFTESAQQFYGLQGLEVFLGDFVYMDGINRPVFANELVNGNWAIGNSAIPFDEEKSVAVNRYEVVVGESTDFRVEVDPPNDGYYVQWRITVPVELNNVISYSTPPPGNVTTVNVLNPNSDVIGEWRISFVAEYRNIQTLEVIASTQSTAILAIVATAGGGTEEETEFASVLEINRADESVEFSYSGVKFSDYSLGSIFEINDNFFLVAGIVKLEDNMTEPVNDPGEETLAQEAARKLVNYRGKVIVVNRTSKTIAFQYDLPDGSYASDSIIDDSNNYVVAETSFVSNSGRIVKLDSFGNVIWQIGGGLFGKINDVRALNNGHVFIST